MRWVGFPEITGRQKVYRLLKARVKLHKDGLWSREYQLYVLDLILLTMSMYRAYLLFSLTVFSVLALTQASAQSSNFRYYDSLFNEVVSVDFDKAQLYLNKQKKLCKTKLDKADYWLNSMMLNYKLNQFSKAREDGALALKYISQKEEERYGTYLKLQALIDWKEGNFTRSNQRLLNAIKNKDVKDPIVRSHLYNVVLNNFVSLEDFDSALIISNKVDLELNTKAPSKRTQSKKHKKLLQSNMLSKGSIYYYIAAYDSALYYYQKAYELNPTDPVWSINCELSIADVLTVKGDYEKAGKYYRSLVKKLEAQSLGINLAHT